MMPKIAKRFVDDVFAEDPGVGEEEKEMFLKLYGMGFSQEKARSMILGSMWMKQQSLK